MHPESKKNATYCFIFAIMVLFAWYLLPSLEYVQ